MYFLIISSQLQPGFCVSFGSQSDTSTAYICFPNGTLDGASLVAQLVKNPLAVQETQV